MIQIFLGSLALSILHPLIPSHWLPILAIGRSERWSRRDIVAVTALAGSSHALSTILIGAVVGLVGYQLSSMYEAVARVVAPAVLVALGVVYLFVGLRHSYAHRHATGDISRRSKSAIIAALAVEMFFSPCMEIEAYYFAAGRYGWLGIAVVSFVYFVVTVSGMVIFVDLARRGMQKIETHLFKYHERSIAGAVLIVLGVITYFVEL
jgi:hypothetical protein